MNLSASSVNAYQQCHLMWYFTYVEAREEPEDEPRLTGIVVHDYAEVILKKGVPLADDPEACGICEMLPHSPQCPMLADTVGPLVDVFINDIYPTYEEPILVEEAFELDVEGVTYTGFIDSVDRHRHGTMSHINALRDLKTTKSRPRAGRYRDALIGYWLGAREMGYQPDSIMLDYIVRTKKPYYWPEEQDVPDQDEIDIWTGRVLETHRLIEEGDWEPTGLGKACSWCPWKDICGPYERWSYMTSPIREEARDANR